MKKAVLIMCLGILFTGCSADEKSSEFSLGETSAEVVLTTTAEIVADEPTEPTTEKKTLIDECADEYPKVAELKLETPNETDLMNREKIIFPTDEGYYYYVYIGGRDSANYALGFDSGDGNAVPIMECEDCVWYFRDGDTIYGTQNKLCDSGKMNICKYENGSVASIVQISSYCAVFFDSEYIYYAKYQGEASEFYRADYNGENIEHIFTVEDSYIGRFAVYNDRIYYNGANYLNIYDMKNGETTEISGGRVGRINGGYMYYVAENKLMRMNLDDHGVEFVCDGIYSFEFCGDMLINWNPSDIYSIQNGEEKRIFNVSDFFDDEYDYYVNNIQVEGERLFIEISSGPYYSYIAELDTDGNFIRKYYENKVT